MIDKLNERSLNRAMDTEKHSKSPYVNYYDSQKDIIKHRRTKSSVFGDMKSKQLRLRMSTGSLKETTKRPDTGEQSEI